MLILHIASGDFFSTYGGGQVYVKNVVDTMIALEHSVAIVSIIGNHNGVIRKGYKGALLVEIGNPDNLEDAITAVRPDVIHAHSLKARACSIGNKLNIPVVVTSHHGGILCPAGTLMNTHDEICHCKLSHKDCLPCVLRNTRTGLKWWYPVMRYLPQSVYLKLGNMLAGMPFIPFVTPVSSAAKMIANKRREWDEIAKGCSRMIAPCHEMAEAMVRNGLAEDKVLVIPHGIPLPKSVPQYPPIENGKIKFFYVGRICYVKGIHVLLEAFHRVEKPNIELHLIGEAANKTEVRYMRKMKRKYADDFRIIWHGKVPPESVYDAISGMHVSSSSSYLEAYGLNIAESLAMGKPVLATRNGGAEMQIEDGVNGWLVPANDVEAMRVKMEEIVQDPSQLPLMAARIPVQSITNHCNELWNVYECVYECVYQRNDTKNGIVFAYSIKSC